MYIHELYQKYPGQGQNPDLVWAYTVTQSGSPRRISKDLFCYQMEWETYGQKQQNKPQCPMLVSFLSSLKWLIWSNGMIKGMNKGEKLGLSKKSTSVSCVFPWPLGLMVSTRRWALSKKKSCQDNIRAVTGYLGKVIGRFQNTRKCNYCAYLLKRGKRRIDLSA